MIIGIDASRAFIETRTGTENYSFHVITQMCQLLEAKKHTFVLFIRPNTKVPRELVGYSNVIVKEVNMKYLWTQLGLAWETWQKPTLDVLWVPAHTLPVLRRPNLKTVVTIHGIEYKWLKEYKNLLQRWYLPLSTIYAAKKATGIIAVSNFTAHELQKETHIDKKRIKVIHEGFIIPAKKALNTTPKVFDQWDIEKHEYILFVGSVQPRKNLVALIQAFKAYVGHFPDHKLVIAGQLAWDFEEIVASPARLKIEDKVIFTGWIGDAELRQLYLGALLYVQPSITEGFGLPVLEAMGCGVPVISSDGGALREVVGRGGIVVPLNSEFASELAKTMVKISKNESLRKKLIALGEARVRALSWVKTAQKTLKHLVNIGSK